MFECCKYSKAFLFHLEFVTVSISFHILKLFKNN